MLFLLPVIAQNGLSSDEIDSATKSFYLGKDGILNGDLVDLPYKILQKYSIKIFGLSAYAIKLPSILVGLAFGLFLVLLLNRWFKNNVSLLASSLIILSTPFLFLAGNGTPLIMIVFWPTILLWLGSKIQGEKRLKPSYCFFFALTMLISIFTPYMIYFALFCVLFVLFQPHLRFAIKNLPKLPLAVLVLVIITSLVALGIGIHNYPVTASELLTADGFSFNQYFNNLIHGLSPVLSWNNGPEGVLLSPLISLPTFALALVGLFSTTKGFFASRNSIASLLIVFCLIITGFNPNAILLIILPVSILIAHGLKYLLEKWYGLFPENPYARVTALLPLTVLFGVMIIPSLFQYLYGYRYNPNVAEEFSYDLGVVRENYHEGTLIVRDNYDFYKILEYSTDITVLDNLDNTTSFASLGKYEELPKNYHLDKIITSPMRNNSDIIYLYSYSEKTEGE